MIQQAKKARRARDPHKFLMEGNLTKLICENLKRIRESRGMRQKDYAKLMGIERHTFCELEGGRCKLSVERVWKLSYVLQIPLSELFDGAETDASLRDATDARD